MKLPVYTVAGTTAPAERIRELGSLLFSKEDQEIVERGTSLELRTRIGQIAIDVSRGGVWGSDGSRLWNFEPVVGRKRNLISGAAASRRTLPLLESYGILPTLNEPFRLKRTRNTGAITVLTTEKNAPRQTIQEDTTILAEIEVDVSSYGLKQKALPMVGGGGRFGVVYGDEGRVIGTRGVWRPPVGKPVMMEVYSQAKADEMFREQTSGAPVKKFSSELAYYCAPAFAGQEKLCPVYVYSGTVEYQGMQIPMRKVILPATDAGPIFEKQPLQPRRPAESQPLGRALPGDFKAVPGKPLPPGFTLNRGLLAAKKLKFEDLFVNGPVGSPLIVNPNIKAQFLKEIGNLLGIYSAGTSWIGLSGGLAGSRKNAQGFVDELAAIGWNIRFNWGDQNAWESDWHKYDDDWVDAVDFVFYTGHANSDGWVLAAPDDTFLHFSETGGAPDMWGANNLEWAVVAACGPLQDEVVGTGGDVLTRWKDAFDGLHILMGYSDVTGDTEEEGKRLVKYAKAGATIIQSWFRTGQEIQGSGPWVGAYYVGDSRGSTYNDHLWGIGSIGPDVTEPTMRGCSWVPC
jgi:hypothetical protein